MNENAESLKRKKNTKICMSDWQIFFFSIEWIAFNVDVDVDVFFTFLLLTNHTKYYATNWHNIRFGILLYEF